MVLVSQRFEALTLALFNVVFVLGVKLRQQAELLEPAAQEEDREEEISGAQFLCETVIRSLTLEEAPDHRPRCRAQHSSHKPKREVPLPPSYSSILLPEGCGAQSFLFLVKLPVVSRGPSFCFERAVKSEMTEKEAAPEEMGAIRLEGAALPPSTGPNQISQEEETKPGQ